MDAVRANGTGRGVPIGEAAKLLGITTTAVRKRIHRGSLLATKNPDGTWTVHLDAVASGQSAGSPSASPDSDERVALLQREIDRLWQELERRAEELRRKDVIISQFAERLPELPVVSTTHPTNGTVRRSWWKFWAPQ